MILNPKWLRCREWFIKKSDYTLVNDGVVYYTNDIDYDFDVDYNFDDDVSEHDDFYSYSILYTYFYSYVYNYIDSYFIILIKNILNILIIFMMML